MRARFGKRLKARLDGRGRFSEPIHDRCSQQLEQLDTEPSRLLMHNREFAENGYKIVQFSRWKPRTWRWIVEWLMDLPFVIIIR